jgi:MFS family permease
VQGTYLTLTLLTTLAASLIWGINTLFLLDAGLSNLEAFAANAFYTAGMVLFEVPTGVVADVRGRRQSFLLGAATLSVGTLLYVLLGSLQAPFAAWAIVSVLLGLGYTFFSGATEAWVVDALHATGYPGTLESVFGRGQAVGGVAMLVGSVGGGVLAQATSLAVPFVLRAALLAATFVVAGALMRDWGWTRVRGESALGEVRRVLDDSLRYGLGRPEVRWVMLVAPFVVGVEVYAFYAMQPYLLQLYGDERAYAVAGLAAAIVAAAHVVGGLVAPGVLRLVRRRTSVLLAGTTVGAVALVLAGLASALAPVLGLLVLWALASKMALPVRQSYLNALIPSRQRATVLSFDSLLGSAGGVVVQPALGRLADVSGYAPTFVASGVLQLAAVPLLLLARRTATPADATRPPARTGRE